MTLRFKLTVAGHHHFFSSRTSQVVESCAPRPDQQTVVPTASPLAFASFKLNRTAKTSTNRLADVHCTAGTTVGNFSSACEAVVRLSAHSASPFSIGHPSSPQLRHGTRSNPGGGGGGGSTHSTSAQQRTAAVLSGPFLLMHAGAAAFLPLTTTRSVLRSQLSASSSHELDHIMRAS